MGDKLVVNIRPSRWRDVRDPRTGKLLFKYDAGRNVVEIKHKHQQAVQVNLTELEE